MVFLEAGCAVPLTIREGGALISCRVNNSFGGGKSPASLDKTYHGCPQNL